MIKSQVAFLKYSFFFAVLIGCIDAKSQQYVADDIKYSTEDLIAFEKWLSEQRKVSFKSVDKIYTIPVVVHVIHLGEDLGDSSNIPDERVYQQIQILNEDFRRKEGTNGYNEHPDGGDAKIEFQLAEVDPDGNPTSGIVRINRYDHPECRGGSGELESMACYNYWNPEHYLNIWLLHNLNPWGDIIPGRASFPKSSILPGLDHDYEADGVFIETEVFGVNAYFGTDYYGRTATHEIGHYLGLYHTFGDAHFLEGDNYCALTDYCDDTPSVNGFSGSCDAVKSCSHDSRAPMTENYMDNVPDNCMNIFTNDQIARMRTVLESSPNRKSLLTSPAFKKTLSLEPTLSELEIFPNPFRNKFILETENIHLSSDNISIFNIAGQTIPFKVNHISSNQIAFTVSGDDKAIVLEIKQQGTIKTFRLVKE